MTTRASAGDPALLEILRREIRAVGPVPFPRFMELALHHPRHGYYAGGEERLGPAGDFFTASDVGQAFGRALARQISEIDERIGRPDPFHVIEFGAGRGLLARDVVDALAREQPHLAGRLRYVMVESSPAMRRAAAMRAPEARVVGPDEVAGGHAGCVLAVELFDALPVHRVSRRSGRLLEVFVGLDPSGELVERELPATAEARAWAERYGAAALEGVEAEVAPGSSALLDALARTIDRGVLIIVDYGHRASELYAAERTCGTLLAYHAHATNEEFLRRVGRQDLTAHVNFTALERRAAETGLAVLGLTTQDRFLIANGLLAEFEQPDASAFRDPSRVKRRLQAMQLIHPHAMGRRFRVLVLSKGCDPPPRLDGLIDPFAAPR